MQLPGSRSRSQRVALVSAAFAVVGLCLAPPSVAVRIAVSTEADQIVNNGECSLREAVRAANSDTASGALPGECPAGSGSDVIALPPGLYTLTISGQMETFAATGDLDLNSNLGIVGAGMDETVVSAGGRDRVFEIAGTRTVELEGLTITGGRTRDGIDSGDARGADGSGSGAGAPASSGVAGVSLDGGGIENAGTLVVARCRISDNRTGDGGAGGDARGGDGGDAGGDGGGATGGTGGDAGDGGGIHNSGVLTVLDSVITSNSTGDGGRGGEAVGGLGGDGAGGAGGFGGAALGGPGGDGGDGGGIATTASSHTMVVDSRLAGNVAGGGGTSGTGVGGEGGLGGGAATGGNGGFGLASTGGQGGRGGGIGAAGVLTVSDSTLSENVSGPGGPTGDAFGGDGGNGGPSGGKGGDGGGAVTAIAGAGGRGGGISAGTLTLTGSTLFHNTTGDGGHAGFPGGGDGGDAVAGNANGGLGGAATAAGGGAAGLGGGVAADGDNGSEARASTLTLNHVGRGGNSENTFGGFGGDGVGTGDGGAGGAAFSGSSGGARGGGLFVGVNMPVRHLTISGNDTGGAGLSGTAQGGGGGSGSPAGPTGSSTVGPPGAVGAGGIDVSLSTPIQNTIVAGNSTPNCSGTLTDDGHNLTFPGSTCVGVSADPVLGPLTDNGGPTKTRALGAGSAALDQVPAAAAGCPATDQRGVGRPQGAACDIGAYEVAPPAVTTGAASDIDAHAAKLNGSVNPNLKASTSHFEFGKTTAYGSSTADAAAGAGNAAVPVSAQAGGLAAGTTYHFRLVASNGDGTSVGADQTFTTAVDPNPVISQLTASNRVFAVGPTPTPLVARAKRGTTFRYSLSEPAVVRFTFQRGLPGRRKGGRCVKPTRALRRAKRCTRFKTAGGLRRSGAKGANRVPFSGRIGRRALKLGRYRALARATDSVGNKSNRASVTFRIVRR
jgi:hypothetical protein